MLFTGSGGGRRSGAAAVSSGAAVARACGPVRSSCALRLIFQACINPIFEKQLQNGTAVNRCASGGCHDNVTGTGGALRLVQTPAMVDVLDPANTPDVIRTTDMYKNFYTAQGAVVIGAPTQSRLFAKPLVLNVLHGGGQIFPDANDPNAKLIAYWITHPAPKDQDEFSTATYSLFTPPVPDPANCTPP